MAILNQKRILNLIPKVSAPVTIHVSQGDVGTEIEFTLVKGDEVFVNPGNVTASVHGVREDGANFGAFTCTLSGSKVTFPLHSEMTAVKGSAIAEVVLVDNVGNKVGSANFGILVEESVFPLGVTYDNDVSVYESILNYVQSSAAQLTNDYTSKINAVQSRLNNEISARTSEDALINTRIDEIIAPSGEAPSAAEVTDARVGVDNVTYPALGDAIRTQITNLQIPLDQFINAEKVNITELLNIGAFVNKNNGNLTSNSATTQYVDYISTDDIICFIVTGNSYANSCLAASYDENKSFVTSYLQGGSTLTTYTNEIIVPKSNEKYFRFSSISDNLSVIALRVRSSDNKHIIESIKYTFNEISELISVTTGGALNPLTGALDTTLPSAGYTNFIPTDGITKFKITTHAYVNACGACSYDENQNFIRAYLVNRVGSTVFTDIEIIPTNNEKYFRFSTVNQGNYPLEVSRYYLQYSAQSQDYLFNKKWVCCGDSYTHGDFSGLSNPDDYTLPDGIYAGEYCVYPYIIGNRNHMNIVNTAVNGMRLAMTGVSDSQRFNFSYPDGVYTQIPTDADYITLYFGINDAREGVPIGDITDNVNTTFYGAWNIVLNEIITNHPLAKIGLIVSNATPPEFSDATRAIAKKWGLPCLDINGDYQVPLMNHVNDKPDTLASVKTLRDNTFRVTSTNPHPNANAHKYESTFIENWLRSL